MSPLPDNLFSVCPQTKRLECSRLLEAADPDDQLYRYTMLRRRRRMLNAAKGIGQISRQTWPRRPHASSLSGHWRTLLHQPQKKIKQGVSSRACTSCISGRTTTPSSSLRAYAPHSITWRMRNLWAEVRKRYASFSPDTSALRKVHNCGTRSRR